MFETQIIPVLVLVVLVVLVILCKITTGENWNNIKYCLTEIKFWIILDTIIISYIVYIASYIGLIGAFISIVVITYIESVLCSYYHKGSDIIIILPLFFNIFIAGIITMLFAIGTDCINYFDSVINFISIITSDTIASINTNTNTNTDINTSNSIRSNITTTNIIHDINNFVVKIDIIAKMDITTNFNIDRFCEGFLIVIITYIIFKFYKKYISSKMYFILYFILTILSITVIIKYYDDKNYIIKDANNNNYNIIKDNSDNSDDSDNSKSIININGYYDINYCDNLIKKINYKFTYINDFTKDLEDFAVQVANFVSLITYKITYFIIKISYVLTYIIIYTIKIIVCYIILISNNIIIITCASSNYVYNIVKININYIYNIVRIKINSIAYVIFKATT